MNTQFKRNILWHTFLFFSAEETSVKLQRSCQLNSTQIHLRDEIASTGKHYPKMLGMLPVRMFWGKKHQLICQVLTKPEEYLKNVAISTVRKSVPCLVLHLVGVFEHLLKYFEWAHLLLYWATFTLSFIFTMWKQGDKLAIPIKYTLEMDINT